MYDTGALIAAERNNRLMWALHKRLLQNGVAPIVPSVVLAQAWRGGPQPQISRLLRGCDLVAFDPEWAKRSGAACAAANTSDIVDAAVVVFACHRKQLVVTSDENDLMQIANALDANIELRHV